MGISFETVDDGRRIVMGMTQKIARIKGLEAVMPEIAGMIYESNRAWMDSKGEGTWPKLAQVTVEKKASQGMMEPSRPMFAEGNLYESVVSPSGPYSYYIPMFDGVVIGVSWTAAKALATGTSTSGVGHHTRIPARPIFPPPTTTAGAALKMQIARFILGWVDGQNLQAAATSARAPIGGTTVNGVFYKGGQYLPSGA